MKKMIVLFFALTMLLSAGTISRTRTPLRSGYELYTFNVTLDGVDTVKTGFFSPIKNKDVSWADYPINIENIFTSGDSDSAQVTCLIYGSFGTSTNDSLYLVETLFTSQSRDTTLAVDFSNVKYPFYQQWFIGDIGCDDSTTVTQKMYP